MEEKRKAERENVCMPGQLVWGDAKYQALVRNLSQDGAMVTVTMGDSCESLVGQECRFEIEPQAGSIQEYDAKVVRVFELDNGECGLAMALSEKKPVEAAGLSD